MAKRVASRGAVRTLKRLDRAIEELAVKTKKRPALRSASDIAALRLVAMVEDMISTGAVRLPYPGLQEAVVDLKRALLP